jgi:hypothetical protein
MLPKYKTPEYKAWQNMKMRCYNPNGKWFKDYGGRGIMVCDRWLHNFDNFLEDMGNKPSPNLTLDRIDNDKDYSPNNCKWNNRYNQNRNRRNIQLHDGKTLTELAKEFHIKGSTIRQRYYNYGWSIDKCLQPVGSTKCR